MILQSYTHGKVITSLRASYLSYKNSHQLFEFWTKSKHHNVELPPICKTIINLTDSKTSVWIDSFGYGLSKYNPNIISIEHDSYEQILKNLPNVFFRTQLDNPETWREINITIKPDMVVFFKSKFFKYLTIPELVEQLSRLKGIFQTSCVYLDLTLIDFNKLKYPKSEIVLQLQEQLPTANITFRGRTDILIII